jgi:rod shape-determining protein MreD
MTRVRVVAAIAALLTALILQATVISAVLLPAPVSLPLLLVAAVALREGAGAGIAYGFAAGLITDLGSRHPAGVLALCWMAVGLICGMVADRGSIRRDVLIATVLATASGVVSTLVMVLLHTDGMTGAAGFADLGTAVAANVVIAFVVVPPVRWFLTRETMQAPRGPVILLGADL